MSEKIPQNVKHEILRKIGFVDDGAIAYLGHHFAPETLMKKIDALESAGLEAPIKLVEKFPALAGYDIERVVNDLKEAGFKEPVGAIQRFPNLAGLNITRVIHNFDSIGFKEPIKSIEKYPQLAGLDPVKVVNKFKEAGLKEPVRIWERCLPLGGLDLNRVIQNFREVGFKDPIRLIEKFPQSAGYDIKRVKRRMELLDRLIQRYSIPGISGREIMETYPNNLFASNIHKIHFSFRILKEFGANRYFTGQQIAKIGNDILMRNPYLVFDFLDRSKIGDIEGLRGIIYSINRMRVEERHGIIEENKKNIQDRFQQLRVSSHPRDMFLAKLAHRLELLEQSKRQGNMATMSERPPTKSVERTKSLER